jgi:hypothetical protein
MINDGGQAFPSVNSEWIGKGYTNVSGMSKRYWTAVMAMQGGYAVANQRFEWPDHDFIVKEAYKIADKMIRAEGESND